MGNRENFIERNALTTIQLSKRGYQHRSKLPVGVKESFFWVNGSEEAIRNLVNDKLESVPKNEDNLVKALENKLNNLYFQALEREKLFLRSIAKQRDSMFKIKQPINLIDKNNDEYAKEFNRALKKLLYKEKTNDLRSLFQDANYASFLARPSNTYSIHQAAAKAGVSVNTAMYHLTDLFLTQAGQKDILRKKQSRIKLEVRKVDNKWLEKFKDYVNKYIRNMNEQIGTAAINSEEFRNLLENNIEQILSEEFTTILSGTGANRLINFHTGNKTSKGISADLERSSKNVLKRVMNLALQANVPGLKIDTPIGPLTLTGETKVDNGWYSTQVSYQLWDANKNLKEKEEMIKLLFNALKNSISAFIGGKGKNNYNQEDIEAEFESNKLNIQAVIETDILKNEVKIRTNEDVKDILARWGYAQTRGILGELAAALALKGTFKKSNVSITGSDKTGAGEMAMDVVAELKGNKFGFQIKNFKNLDLRGLYQTDFSVSKNNGDIMKKYFGNDADVYYWFFTNRQMLDETGILSTASFSTKMEFSFYNYADNFLRISSGDTLDKEVRGSDVFFIKDKIIPASFLYYKLIQNVKNAKNKENMKRFTIQKETNKYKYQEAKSNEVLKSVKVADLIPNLNARIEFKGININLENFN